MIDTGEPVGPEGETAVVRVELLGPVRVYADDGAGAGQAPVEVGGPRLRMLLARLALGEGRTVSTDSLVDGLWGQAPPADAANALQALVSRLRRSLRGAATVESAPGGYRLPVRPEDVDVHRFEDLAARGRRELGVDPSAELREVHLALLRGRLETPAGRGKAAPGPLPARLTSFVGRDAELGGLARQLDRGRLVTIVGPGGAGKTRLSCEAATRDRAHARGRVWFVPLAGVSAPDQLADAVLGALSSTDGGLYDAAQGQRATPVERMAGLFGSGDALLLLDNCEHLVEAAAELAAELLDQLPELRILATSREALAITGEALCHLGPLDVPTGSPEPAEAAQSPAVRLFVDRATGVRPDFALDDRTLDAVVEVCRRLDGMPLALELAAAKLRSMSVG
ncbi:ATP-binding protein, partial [Streptomyces goshikiensis]